MLVDPTLFNNANEKLYAGFPIITKYKEPKIPVEQFDHALQSQWHMPADSLAFALEHWIIMQCTTDEQLERVDKELQLYKERDLLLLLRFLKYMVDTFRKHNIVWGVGRGSSVASYVLFLIGVHKVDSLKYGLDIEEFLRPKIEDDK